MKSEETKKLRGEGYGKRFSKQWWSNIWYYYKFYFLGAAFLAVLIGIGIHDYVTYIEPDSAIHYFGTHAFTTEQYDGMHNYLTEQAKDINNDGKATSIIYLNAYDPSAKDEQSLGMGQKMDLEFAAGDAVIFWFDKACFDMVSQNDKFAFIDLTEWAEELGVPKEQLVEVNGQNIGMKMNGNGLLTTAGINFADDIDDEDNIYMIVRGRRYNEDQGDKMIRYEYGLEVARHIMSLF